MPEIVATGLDLLAGVLIGVDLLITPERLARIEKCILAYLETLKDPLRHPRSESVKLSLGLTFLVFVVLCVYGAWQDVQKGRLSADLAMSYGMLLLGSLLGLVVLVIVVWGIAKLLDSLHLGRIVESQPIALVILPSFALALPPLFVLKYASNPIVSLVLGFSFNVLLLGLVLEVFLLLTPFLKGPGHTIAKLGLAIFVLTRLVQLLGYAST